MSEIDELDWKDDEVEFCFESDEVYDTKEKRNTQNRIEEISSLGLGSDNRNIENALRKHKKELNWEELERRGKKKMEQKEKMKYKKIDLLNGYEKEMQWRIRMKINSNGDINSWIEV